MRAQEEHLSAFHIFWEVFILFAAILSVVLVSIEFAIELDPESEEIMHRADLILISFFVIDIMWKFNTYLAHPDHHLFGKSTLSFIKHNWLDLLAILPFFRIFRFGRYVQLTRVSKVSKAAKVSTLTKISKLTKTAELTKASRLAKTADLAKTSKLANVAEIAKTGNIAEISKVSQLGELSKASHVTEAAHVSELSNILAKGEKSVLGASHGKHVKHELKHKLNKKKKDF